MTIDGTDILAVYGLKVLKVEGPHDLPARKKTIEPAGTEEKDIVLTSPKIKFSLRGSYSSAALLVSNLKAFETALKSPLKHAVVEPARSLTFTGVAAGGFAAKTFLRFGVVLIDLTFTVVTDDLET